MMKTIYLIRIQSRTKTCVSVDYLENDSMCILPGREICLSQGISRSHTQYQPSMTRGAV